MSADLHIYDGSQGTARFASASFEATFSARFTRNVLANHVSRTEGPSPSFAIAAERSGPSSDGRY